MTAETRARALTLAEVHEQRVDTERRIAYHNGLLDKELMVVGQALGFGLPASPRSITFMGHRLKVSTSIEWVDEPDERDLEIIHKVIRDAFKRSASDA